jgi:Skp family chaperone for outer membrane proteins
MNAKHLGATVALIALAVAAGAQAQTKKASHAAAASTAAAPAASPTGGIHLTHGPVIPGLCVYSNTRVLEISAVGKAYAARMQQLQAQAAAELSGQQSSLQADEKTLIGKRATLSQEQFNQQAQPLAQREQSLNQVADARTRDLRYTAAHQQQRIAVVIEPLVASAYEAHKCSILLNADTVMAGNPAMDLSEEVAQALNGKMSTITFDRETAPAQ